MTIRKQLLYTIILLNLIPMLIVPWLGNIYIRNVVKDQLLSQSRSQLEEVAENTEDILQSILLVSNVIAADEAVREILRNDVDDIQSRTKMIGLLSDINAVYLYRYNVAITIYGNDGRAYSTLGDGQSEEEVFRLKWREETIANQAFFVWKTFAGLSKNAPILGMSRNLYNQNGKKQGVLCIEIYKDQQIDRLLQQESDMEDTERCLVSGEGDIVLSYTKNGEEGKFSEELYETLERKGVQESGEMVMEGTDYVYFQKEVKNTDWKIIQVVPYNKVFSKLNYFRNFTYLSNILCMAVLLLIDGYMTKKISRSLTHLGDAMKQVRQGHFITLQNRERNLEMRQIYEDFNSMSTRLEQLFNENIRITTEKEEYRRIALQTQIQPHFLFNTLNGIKWLCIIESAPTAERMMESLGHILEYSLENAKDCVPLTEEITCLRHYVELQKMRYGNIFDVIYRIDEEMKNLEVPVLLLQPLVENSIVHGIREKKDQGMIIVSARLEDGKNVLEVEDNGVGISSEKLGQIMASRPSGDSIGVMNVKERISLYYRETKFEVSSETGKGTKIRMILGRRREQDETGDR